MDPNDSVSAFDVWTNIVIPSALGISGLVVAAASLLVSRSANSLARQIADRSSLRDEHAERMSIVEAIFAWARGRWPAVAERPDRAAEHSGLAVISARLMKSELEGAGELQDLLWSLDREHYESTDDWMQDRFGRPWFNGLCMAVVEGAIIQWLRDPKGLPGARDQLWEILSKGREDGRIRAQEHATAFAAEIEERAARREGGAGGGALDSK